MKRNFAVMGSAFLLWAVASAVARADVKMPALFGDNMVLQRGVSVPIWGWADAGEKVTVKLLNQTKETAAGADGSWMVKLEPLTAAENAVLQINGNNEIKINNVAVGEVWLASGQSNMEFALNRAHNAQEAIAASADPLLRSINVVKGMADAPLKDINSKSKWQIARPDTSGSFTAVGYFFARELRKKLNVPVGIIHSSWGGTPAEAWASLPALQAETDFAPIMERSAKSAANYTADLEKYNTVTLPNWEAARQKAKDEDKPEPARPRAPDNPTTNPKRPAVLYNAMIAPLVPYAMKGAIWYQGEANAGRSYQYRKLLPAMIADWRQKWGITKPEDYGFYIVQLANYMAEKPEPSESGWAELREAQTLTANMPGNGQGLAIDIGDDKDIHPRNKQDVGIRLALAALAKTYGQTIEYSGPVYDSMSKDGNKIRLKFTHADGLMSKIDPIPGFAIAGEDKKWKWAQANIEGREIVVWNDAIANPVAVRYAWADNPKATLYNAAGLPAVPFRTDDWPGATVNSK